jgi:hypothetical protein
MTDSRQTHNHLISLCSYCMQVGCTCVLTSSPGTGSTQYQLCSAVSNGSSGAQVSIVAVVIVCGLLGSCAAAGAYMYNKSKQASLVPQDPLRRPSASTILQALPSR